MKKKSLLSTLLLIIGLGAYTILNTSYSGGFGSYSNTSCTTCHGNGMPNTSLLINNLPATYALGQSYPISVTVSDMNRVIAGFQLRSNIGTFTTTDPNVSAYPGGLSVGHNSPKALIGGMANFTMIWTAPSSGNVAANFAAQGIAANGNNSNSGDGAAIVTVSNVVLPVQFIEVTATAKTKSIEIKFETTEEKDIKSFEVERSLNGISFQSIGSILPKGAGYYEIEDFSAEEDIPYYYRIREVSTDNKSTFSKIVSAKIKSTSKLEINPTRTGRSINITGLEQNETVSFTLYSLSGKVMKQIKKVSNQIELYNVASGIYVVALAKDNKPEIVQKIQIK